MAHRGQTFIRKYGTFAAATALAVASLTACSPSGSAGSASAGAAVGATAGAAATSAAGSASAANSTTDATTNSAAGSESAGPSSSDSANADSATTGSGTTDSASTNSSSANSASTSASPVVGKSAPTGDLVLWPDNAKVSHIFFHSLIVDPKITFNLPTEGAGYADYFVTISEFNKVLQQVYDKNYVLVSPHQLAKVDEKGNLKSIPLMLPKGKKPLVLSIDDVSYYEYMEGDGFATKLIVQPDGKVVNEYKDPKTGKVSIGNFDVMPIVDEFVAKHPDFSHEGARGVLAMTGYNGVFGYRTSAKYYSNNPSFAQDVTEAKKVAEALKKNGWEFASHSWGHLSMTTSSLERIKWDMGMYRDEVEPILGKTDLLIYPFGADISGVKSYGPDNAKFNFLKGQGYSYYFNVDSSSPAWGQIRDTSLREARINIDGLSLRAAIVDGRKVLNEFFDPKSVLDPERPKSIAGTVG